MIKFKLFAAFFACMTMVCFVSKSQAQSDPVMYFCESYSSGGEVGISDRFYTGYLTVMVKCGHAIGLRECSIQYDKYDPSSRSFKYYKKFPFTVKPSMDYIYFERSGENDMSFDATGIYRVFLLDDNGKTIASALIEII